RDHVRAGASWVTMLLGERTLHSRRTAVVGPRERGSRRGKRVVAELRAPFVELLVVPRGWQWGARIASPARCFVGIGASLARDAEGPLDLVVVRLEFLIGDRPVGQVRPGHVAIDRPGAELVLRHAEHPTGPVRGSPT